MQVLKTPLGKSYWNEDSPNTPVYTKLYDELVPASGSAETLHGELIRCGSRLAYDFCNNGNCNVIEMDTYTEDCWSCSGDGVDPHDTDEECPDCYGTGHSDEYDGEITIGDYYKNFLNLLKITFIEVLGQSDSVTKLQEFLFDRTKGYGIYTYDDAEMDVYNTLMDDILLVISKSENKPYKSLED